MENTTVKIDALGLFETLETLVREDVEFMLALDKYEFLLDYLGDPDYGTWALMETPGETPEMKNIRESIRETVALLRRKFERVENHDLRESLLSIAESMIRYYRMKPQETQK